MKILVLSRFGEIVDVCYRMVQEGNEVSLFVLDKELQWVGKGWGINKLDKVSSDDYKRYDLIILEDTCWGDLFTELRSRGYKVIGASRLIDKLEQDRDFFYRNCQLLRLKSPPSVKFDRVEDAIKYIKRYPKRYVLKSHGADKSITCVSKINTSIDLIMFLEGAKDIVKIFLQPAIKGVEVAVSAFFNGEDFIPPLFINYEHKKFGNDNTGIYTGEMGTVVWLDENFEAKFFKEVLYPFRVLLKNQFVGIVDINTITNTSGSYLLEITPRFGYPITDILSEYFTSWSKLLFELATKNYDAVLNNLKKDKPYAIGVVMLAISPLEDQNKLIGKPLASLNVNPNLLNNFRFYGVVKENNKFYISDKYLGVATSSGKTIEEAIQNVYSVVSKIDTPSLFYYRTDIGKATINQHKWLSGLKIF